MIQQPLSESANTTFDILPTFYGADMSIKVSILRWSLIQSSAQGCIPMSSPFWQSYLQMGLLTCVSIAYKHNLSQESEGMNKNSMPQEYLSAKTDKSDPQAPSGVNLAAAALSPCSLNL